MEGDGDEPKHEHRRYRRRMILRANNRDNNDSSTKSTSKTITNDAVAQMVYVNEHTPSITTKVSDTRLTNAQIFLEGEDNDVKR